MRSRHTARTEDAARAFYNELLPTTQLDAWPLVLAAFTLHAEAWGPFDIRTWQWPLATLQAGTSFDGEEPWTVLLRRAVELAGRAA